MERSPLASADWRRDVREHAFGPGDDEMFRIDGADPPCGELASLAQVRRARPHIVRVGRQNMDTALVEHPLSPVLRTPTETPVREPAMICIQTPCQASRFTVG
jgi:hypothetical protein